MVRPRRGPPTGHGSYQRRSDEFEIRRRKHAVQLLRDGCSQKQVARVFRVTCRTIHNWRVWLERFEAKKKQPKTGLHRRGRNRKLTDEEVRQIDLWLQEDSHTTATDIVERLGGKVSHSTVCAYIKELGYSVKQDLIGDKPLTSSQIKETKVFAAEIKNIPYNRRVYMDESFLYGNEHQSWGYAKTNQTPVTRLPAQAPKYTVYWAITNRGQVHDPIVTTQNASDENFVNYVRDYLAPAVPYQSTVLWDRLGRSGRARNPKAQHYNPEARRLLRRRRAKVKFLPPYGKYFNPIELAYGALKMKIRKSYSSSQAARENRLWTVDELQEVAIRVARSFKLKSYRTWFNQRGDIDDFVKHYPEIRL